MTTRNHSQKKKDKEKTLKNDFLSVLPIIIGLVSITSIWALRFRQGPAGYHSYEILEATGFVAARFSLNTIMIVMLVSAWLTVGATVILGKKLGLSKKESSVLGLIVALSPLRIAQTTQVTRGGIILPIMLCAGIALKSKKKALKGLGSLLLIATAYAGADYAVVAFIFAAVVLGQDIINKTKEIQTKKTRKQSSAKQVNASTEKENRDKDFSNEKERKILLTGIALGQICLVLLLKKSYDLRIGLAIADFSKSAGIGLFELILFVIGVGIIWKRKPVKSLLTAIAAISAVLLPAAVPLVGILINEMTRKVLARLWSQEWTSQTLKQTTTLVLVCGLLFSTIASAKTAASLEPTVQDKSSIARIEHLIEKSTLIVPEKDARIIESITGKKTIRITQDQIETLEQSREYETTEAILELNQVEKIIIAEREKFKNLIFVMENKEEFTMIIDTEGISVWSRKEETFINTTE